MDFTNLTASEIDTLKVEKEKKLQDAQRNLFEVEQKVLEIGHKILVLQTEKKEYQIAESKAQHIVKTINLDIKIIASAFWNARNGGI